MQPVVQPKLRSLRSGRDHQGAQPESGPESVPSSLDRRARRNSGAFLNHLPFAVAVDVLAALLHSQACSTITCVLECPEDLV